MSTTTIKVPVELRDRLAERARREHATLSTVITHALDLADAAAFWENVRSTMGTGEAQTAIAREAEAVAGSLADGLDPDEDWSDIL
jgi:predicted transcriptional regulator